MSTHRCAAAGCRVVVSTRYLMCGRHWRLVPKAQQDAVWRAYRPGQEREGVTSASPEYLKAVEEAVAAVAQREPAQRSLL